MGATQRKKRIHKNIRDQYRKSRTRARTKDLDQIHEDLRSENAPALLHQPEDGDLPGLGQFYCIYCARHFVDDFTLNAHLHTKVHKRRVKELKEQPYTIEEAEAAGGLGRYEQPQKVAVPQYEMGPAAETPQTDSAGAGQA
eukprot:m.62531 g.62531  ORF g.62531 m.62531 type:complete len:141 (-) comp7405_c0_seq4:96-518(-)